MGWSLKSHPSGTSTCPLRRRSVPTAFAASWDSSPSQLLDVSATSSQVIVSEGCTQLGRRDVSGETQCGSSEQGPEGFALNSHWTQELKQLWGKTQTKVCTSSYSPSIDHPQQVPALPWPCSCSPTSALPASDFTPSGHLCLHQLQPLGWCCCRANSAPGCICMISMVYMYEGCEECRAQDSPGWWVHNPSPAPSCCGTTQGTERGWGHCSSWDH